MCIVSIRGVGVEYLCRAAITEYEDHGVLFEIITDDSTDESPKPCEETCRKCGNDDIHRRFVDEHTNLSNDWGALEKTPSVADPKGFYIMAAYAGYGKYLKASKDHIKHVCRSCGYIWRGDVL